MNNLVKSVALAIIATAGSAQAEGLGDSWYVGASASASSVVATNATFALVPTTQFMLTLGRDFQPDPNSNLVVGFSGSISPYSNGGTNGFAYNYALAARAGILTSPTLLVYGTAGVGKDYWRTQFVGVGADYLMSDDYRVRFQITAEKLPSQTQVWGKATIGFYRNF